MPSVSTVKWTNHRGIRLNTKNGRVLRHQQNGSITSNLSFNGVRDKNKQRYETLRNVKENRQSVRLSVKEQSGKEKRQNVKNFTLQFKKRSDDILRDDSCKVQCIKKEKWKNVNVKWENESRKDEKRRRSWKQSKRWRLKEVLIPLMILNVTGQVNGAVEGKNNCYTCFILKLSARLHFHYVICI